MTRRTKSRCGALLRLDGRCARPRTSLHYTHFVILSEAKDLCIFLRGLQGSFNSSLRSGRQFKRKMRTATLTPDACTPSNRGASRGISDFLLPGWKSMRRAFAEGLRAGWDDLISSALLAREFLAALLDCVVDIVSGRPLPHIDLPEVTMGPEAAARRSRRRDKAA